MTKKVLFVASVYCFFPFEINNMKILKQLGYEVHTIANLFDNTCNQTYSDDFLDTIVDKKLYYCASRNPFCKDNYKAYKVLKKLIQNEDYDIIDCHTPIGGVLARLASKKVRRKSKTKLIYTAHGFHFYKGAPKKNWLLYYPIEKLLSKYTDVMITINQEDYLRAKNHFKAKKIIHVNGVGLALERFTLKNFNVSEYRKSLDLNEKDFLIVSAGELNQNKNHEVIIRALALLKNKSIKYLIAGDGQLKEYLNQLIKSLNLESTVRLLGHRHDIVQLDTVADAFAFPSKREGLGLAALEAMACGSCLITSNVHGINDYSINGKTGLNCNADDVHAFARHINYLFENKEFCEKCGFYNKEAVKKYSINNVNKIMWEIYKYI